MHAWSLRTLDRRLRWFDIYRTDPTVTEEALRTAVTEELDGPGKLLGYRAMTNKIRQEHNLKVPRRVVHAMMYDVNPEGDPRVIGLWYLEFLYETKQIASIIRLDKGTETGKMATLHSYLRRHHNDMDPYDTVIFGKSTSNQVLVI